MSEQKTPRRSMVGAPPTKKLSVPEKGTKRGKAVEEEEIKEESSSDSDEDEEQTTESQSKEESSPSRKKRKKRRLRLTDYGNKAKKRAERRERDKTEKKEVSDEAAESPRKEKESVEEEVIYQPKFDEYKSFQLLCDCLLRTFIQKDPEEFFSQPVLPSVAPDYHQVIDTPMDFYTMRKKVDNNEYKHIEELKKDITLIAENAMSYNKPNTVYYLAAQKLLMVAKYYFSETYLEFLRYSLPFGNEIPHEQMGLKPKVPIKTVIPSSRKDPKSESIRAAITDKVDAKTVLKQNSAANRCKLSEKKPDWHLGYLDKKKEGPISLNILTGDEKCPINLGDYIGRLDKGTPCLPSTYELYEEFDAPISYTNYGPFGSFAPQFDSTWATLTKQDSDTLMACYGDKQNTVDALSLRRMAADTSESLLKAVDGILDSLTDGEHSRTMKNLEGDEGNEEEESKSEDKEVAEPFMRKLLDDIGSLENLGIDVSYLKGVRSKFGLEEKIEVVDEILDANGRMLSDLNSLQQNRLNADPALNLGDLQQPSQNEVMLAGRVAQQLTNGITQYAVPPSGIASTQAVHQAVGINDDECDYDLLQEFMFIT